ncbi:hypothetical protein EJ377_15605 [Chryseobacterium arthrosphaerae]|uniref:Uncharacterized protein n=1 Tax=Chryseobacterium arthrosphaerae TaxID=651561 RepID=A0A432DSA8_9FLAO|nr:hypothetical protein EJ377_15605 [Chryseobacterium arthrosphaerae]
MKGISECSSQLNNFTLPTMIPAIKLPKVLLSPPVSAINPNPMQMNNPKIPAGRDLFQQTGIIWDLDFLYISNSF